VTGPIEGIPSSSADGVLSPHSRTQPFHGRCDKLIRLVVVFAGALARWAGSSRGWLSGGFRSSSPIDSTIRTPPLLAHFLAIVRYTLM
jgi:hypothetical protein